MKILTAIQGLSVSLLLFVFTTSSLMAAPPCKGPNKNEPGCPGTEDPPPPPESLLAANMVDSVTVDWLNLVLVVRGIGIDGQRVSVDLRAGYPLDGMKEEKVQSITQHLQSDPLIEAAGQNWRLGRMGTVERNVLRMATYEMMHMDDAPSPVVMNEAVDITKYFSSDESGRFVNGLLDRIRRDLKDSTSK